MMSDHYDRYNGMDKLLGTNLAEVGTDCISRQAAIDAAIEAVDDWDGGTNIGRQKRIEKYINALPSAEPQKIRGKWIDKGWTGDWEWQADGRGKHWHEWECNICHHYFAERSFFCPHCGSDMRGEQYG